MGGGGRSSFDDKPGAASSYHIGLEGGVSSSFDVKHFSASGNHIGVEGEGGAVLMLSLMLLQAIILDWRVGGSSFAVKPSTSSGYHIGVEG